MSPRNAIFSALGILAGGLLVWALASIGSSDVRNVPVRSGPIVAFGDSLVQGVGATKGNDLVSLLSRKTGREIANLGVSGDTTAAGLARVNAALDLEPSVAIVLLGGNDFLRRVPQAETFNNLRQIVARFQESGAAVIILGVRGGILSDGYDKLYKELAKDTRSAYVSDVLDGLLGDSRYMSDSIHPNDRGYARIADRVYPVLQDILKGR